MFQYRDQERSVGFTPLEHEKGSRPSKMMWLFLPSQAKKKELGWFLEEPDVHTRISVGSYAYWIRVWDGITELCRTANDSLISYEVLHHAQLGISDEDIEDAIHRADGEITVNKEYPISDQIRKKLQILYEPE